MYCNHRHDGLTCAACYLRQEGKTMKKSNARVAYVGIMLVVLGLLLVGITQTRAAADDTVPPPDCASYYGGCDEAYQVGASGEWVTYKERCRSTTVYHWYTVDGVTEILIPELTEVYHYKRCEHRTKWDRRKHRTIEKRQFRNENMLHWKTSKRIVHRH